MQFQEKNVQVQQYLQTIQKRWRDESYARTMEGRKLFKNDGGTEVIQKRWRNGTTSAANIDCHWKSMGRTD